MKAVLDEFEGDKARLEEIGTRKQIVVPRSTLPSVAGEGSVLDNSTGAWRLDNAEAAARREKSSELVNKLLK